MKKMLSALLIITFLISGSITYATEIDFSSYTDSELILLFEKLNEELLARKIVKSAKLPVGRYTVGTDIPAGKYVIEMADKSKYSGPIIKIYTDSMLSKTSFSEWLEGSYDTMIIDLKNGNVLETDETIILSTFVGITFE